MKEVLQAVSIAVPRDCHESTVGIDLGDRWSRYCVVDRAGSVVEEDRVHTTAEALKERFGAAAADTVGPGSWRRPQLCDGKTSGLATL